MHTFKYAQWTITGSSIASDQTCLLVKELGVCFDMGFTFPDCIKKGRIVVASHGHADHVGSLHLHIRKRLRNNLPAATYVIPRVCKSPLLSLYSAVCALDEGDTDVNKFDKTASAQVGLLISEDNPMIPINEQMFIRGFDVTHKIPSRGYVIYERRRKLKPEFANIANLGQYRKQNPQAVVDEQVVAPIIGFSGDTTIDGVLRNDDLLNSKLLLLECTYIGTDDVTAQQARERGHIHIDDIKQNWDRFNNQMVLLIHLSPRYELKDIQKAHRDLPDDMVQRLQFFDMYSSDGEKL
jgi:ribonuclease Z